MFRGDPARTGRSDTPLPELTATEWSCDLGGPIDSSPAVVGGTVYVGTASGAFCAVEASSGNLTWKTDVGHAIVSSPCVAAGKVFFGSVDGHVHALDATSGKEVWRARTGRSVVAEPLALGDLLICGSTDGRLYAWSVADGSLAWRTDAGAEIHAGAAAAAEAVVYADYAGRVRCVRTQDGVALWPEPYMADGPVVACPTIEGGLVVLSSLAPTALSPPNSLNIHCLDLGAGTRVWGTAGHNPWQTDKEGPMSVATCPTVIGGAVWFVTGEGYGNWSAVLRSLLLATGARGVAIPPDFGIQQPYNVTDSSPAAAGGVLYFADYAGFLNQFSTVTNRPLRPLPLGAKSRSSPALSDGRLYLGLTNGKLLCIR